MTWLLLFAPISHSTHHSPVYTYVNGTVVGHLFTSRLVEVGELSEDSFLLFHAIFGNGVA